MAQGLLLPVLPLYARAFDAPYFWVGLLLAGDGLGLLLGDLPAGMVLRRLDRQRGMLLGLGLVGAATMGLFFAPTLPAALALRFFSGLGVALYNVARHTYVADTITLASRGQSVALLGASFRVGRMVGPVVGGALAAEAGLRAPFLVYGVVCALAAFTVAVVASARRRAGAAQGPASQPAPTKSLARDDRLTAAQARALAAPGLGHFLMQMVRAGPPVVLPLYASTVLGLDVQQIGLIFGVSSLVDAALFYPTGLIMDRLGRKWAIVPSALIMALGLAVVPFTASFAGLLGAAVLNGFGNGLGSGVMITLGADLAPARGRGSFLGLWNLIGDAGVSSGPLLVGSITDLLALGPATWAIAGVGAAAGTVFSLLVPETLRKKPT
jgi:MFS family permease